MFPVAIDGNAALVPAPSEKIGQPELADQLRARYTDASQSLRRVVAFGVFLWDLKENQLKHGQFGPFLKLHCPEFVTERMREGKSVLEWRTLQHYMDLTKRVLDLCGVQIRNTVADLSKGDFLFLPENQLSPNIKQLKDQICVIVDNKSQRQLMWNIGLSEPKQHHPRKPVNADDVIAKEDAEAAQFVIQVTGDCLLLSKSIILCHASHQARFELQAAAKALVAVLDEIDGDPAAYAAKLEAGAKTAKRSGKKTTTHQT